MQRVGDSVNHSHEFESNTHGRFVFCQGCKQEWGIQDIPALVNSNADMYAALEAILNDDNRGVTILEGASLRKAVAALAKARGEA